MLCPVSSVVVPPRSIEVPRCVTPCLLRLISRPRDVDHDSGLLALRAALSPRRSSHSITHSGD